MSEAGLIELLYGDASRISEQPCVAYGWQFSDEEVFMPAERGAAINLFCFITRTNQLIFEMTTERITSEFLIRQIEKYWRASKSRPSLCWITLRHIARRAVRERLPFWEARGLFVFYLPVYSPDLFIAEILWWKLKYEWLSRADYLDWEN